MRARVWTSASASLCLVSVVPFVGDSVLGKYCRLACPRSWLWVLDFNSFSFGCKLIWLLLIILGKRVRSQYKVCHVQVTAVGNWNPVVLGPVGGLVDLPQPGPTREERKFKYYLPTPICHYWGAAPDLGKSNSLALPPHPTHGPRCSSKQRKSSGKESRCLERAKCGC